MACSSLEPFLQIRTFFIGETNFDGKPAPFGTDSNETGMLPTMARNDIRDDGTATDGERSEQYEWRDDETPITAVIQAVANATDRGVSELPALSEQFDPDALNALLTSARDNRTDPVSVSFAYGDVDVFVESSGRILVTDPS